MSKLAARLRRLAADCRQCRHVFCCGQCLCCLPEDDLHKIVQEAQAEIVGTLEVAQHELFSVQPLSVPSEAVMKSKRGLS